MKKILIVALISFISGSVSLAQSNLTHPKQKPIRPVAPKFEQMRKDLKLTDAQFAQIRSIHSKYRAQMPLTSPDQMTPAERSTAKRLHKEEHAAIQAVLTPAQRQKAEALRKQRVPAPERSGREIAPY
jgi:Spy/CpxP family protein refolding chaperone